VSVTALPYRLWNNVIDMSQEAVQEKEYQYSVEIGHAKQGSEHVLIIKSLKVKDDNLADCLALIKVGLAGITELIE